MTDGRGRAHHRLQHYPVLSRLVLVLALIAACGAGLPEPIREWPVIRAAIDGRPLRLVLAVNRQQGLQGVTELTGADGMLFDFGREVEPATGRFWMRDVLIPLDITWFDDEGRLVGTATMATCEQDCPRYAAPGPFRWAVETPAGALALRNGAVLELDG